MYVYEVVAIVLSTAVTVCFIIYSYDKYLFYDKFILIVGSRYLALILYVSMKIFSMGKLMIVDRDWFLLVRHWTALCKPTDPRGEVQAHARSITFIDIVH